MQKPASVILLSRKDFLRMTSRQRSNAVGRVVDHYHTNGYPYASTSREYRNYQLNLFMAKDYMHCYDGKQRVYSSPYNPIGSFGWSFFPHHIRVKCNVGFTPHSTIQTPDRLRRIVDKLLRYGDITDGSIRRGLRFLNGHQSVSNFPPTIAAAIYHKFGGKDGTVWDMSMGYGGRMCGAARAGVRRYIGTDPCTPTYNGLISMSKFLSHHPEVITAFELYKQGSETFRPRANSIDLCFTSPPYFGLEQYSRESTQSYIKYPTQSDWLHGFLGETIENCHHGLKLNKYLVINISNVRTYPDLVNDTINLVKSIGFQYVDRQKLLLSAMSKKQNRFEPILIFKKR